MLHFAAMGEEKGIFTKRQNIDKRGTHTQHICLKEWG
jgi:hypothetical protein